MQVDVSTVGVNLNVHNLREFKKVASIQDEDPYVRKTAAVCVAKLYDINNQMVEEQGFLDALKDLLSDSNPMVRFTFKLIDLHRIAQAAVVIVSFIV